MLSRGGSTDPSKQPNDPFVLYSIPAFDHGQPEFVRGSDIGSPKKNVQSGDVLLSRIVPHIRRCWIVGEHPGKKILASGEWIVFRSDKIYAPYLRHFLVSNLFHQQFMQTVAGVGGSLLRANPNYVAKIVIPLPSVGEQRRIAAILDKADTLRRNRKRSLDLLGSLTQSIFLETFGEPKKEYPTVKLSEVCLRITDGVHQKPNYVETGIPFISVKDITTGKLILDKCKFISQSDHDKYTRRCKPELGDVLYTKVGATYGRPALVDTDQPFSIYVSVALINPNRDRISPRYLQTAVGMPGVKSQADRRIKGIGVPDLHLDQIQNFTIPLPPL